MGKKRKKKRGLKEALEQSPMPKRLYPFTQQTPQGNPSVENRQTKPISVPNKK